MIKNVRHTGIVVRDLEKMAEFYCQLGFVEESRAVEEGEFIDQVVNIHGVNLEWIKMRSPDGYFLELLQYHSHPQELNADKAKSNDFGCSHLAYTVENIVAACKKISTSGGNVVNPPSTSPDGKVKVAYCHDPEGVLMEIVEVIA